jgi:type III secretion protein F
MATTNNGLSFSTVNSNISTIVAKRETGLQDFLTNLGENPSTADMLTMQQRIQEWTITTQLQSTVVQSIAEAIKGVIQKSG